MIRRIGNWFDSWENGHGVVRVVILAVTVIILALGLGCRPRSTVASQIARPAGSLLKSVTRDGVLYEAFLLENWNGYSDPLIQYLITLPQEPTEVRQLVSENGRNYYFTTELVAVLRNSDRIVIQPLDPPKLSGSEPGCGTWVAREIKHPIITWHK